MTRGPGPKILALLVFVTALWAQSDALVGVFYDDGIYVVGAKALAEGQGYRNIHLPGAPAIVHYPFLYPAALSLLWRLWPAFPDNVALFALLDAAAFAFAAWLVARHALSHFDLPPWLVYAALGIGFTAFPLLTIVGLRLSEAMFLALTAGAIAAADGDGTPVKRGAAAGLLAGLAMLARSIGVAVAAGVVIGLWARRERRAATIAAIVAALSAVPWMWWVVRHAREADGAILGNYGTYVSEARQAGIGAMLQGLDLQAFGALGRVVLPSLPGPLWYGLAALFLGTIVVASLAVWRRAPALITSLGLYVLVVSLWPYAPHRFMWITLPWFAVLLAVGVRWLSTKGRAGRVVALALTIVAVWGYAPRQTVSLRLRSFAATSEGISQSFRPLIGSIATELPAGAVIASEDEALMYLYTGRRTVPSYLFRWSGRGTEPAPSDSALAFYCRAGVTHIGLTGPAAQTVPPVAPLLDRPDSVLVPLFVTQGPALYRFQCPA